MTLGADKIAMLLLLAVAVIVTAIHAIGRAIKAKRDRFEFSNEKYRISLSDHDSRTVERLHRHAFGNISGSGQNKPERFMKPGAADFFRNSPS